MLCNLCPRKCNAERLLKEGSGFCKSGSLPVISRAAPHMWQEPCISGTRGSGTIFFSGCSLGCVFCQNERISHQPFGRSFTPDELAKLFHSMEELKVHNINLVTPTHFAPAIMEALRIYKPSVPVVWNSSGYELPEMIRALEGLVDIFLPDFKYASESTAKQLADAQNYFNIALKAIQTMCKVSGPPQYDENGMLLKGTIIRHLVLPMRTGESLTILDTIAKELPQGTPVSLMRQYTPMNDTHIPGLDRRLTPREYRRVCDHMLELGLPGFIQEKEAASAVFTPAFMDEESTRLFPADETV